MSEQQLTQHPEKDDGNSSQGQAAGLNLLQTTIRGWFTPNANLTGEPRTVFPEGETA